MFRTLAVVAAISMFISGCQQEVQPQTKGSPSAGQAQSAPAKPTSTPAPAKAPASKPGGGKKASNSKAAPTSAAAKKAPASAAPADSQGKTLPAGAEAMPKLPAEVVKGVGSAANPAVIAHAAKAPVVDGKLDDWQGVAVLPDVFDKRPASSFMICWTPDGIWGVAVVKDDKVTVRPDRTWRADGIEVFIGKGTSGVQYCLSPDEGGKCGVWAGPGDSTDTRSIQCASRLVSGGYVIEFMVSAEAIAGAKLAAGEKLYFNAAIDNDGTAAEQVFADKGQTHRTPADWGVIELGK